MENGGRNPADYYYVNHEINLTPYTFKLTELRDKLSFYPKDCLLGGCGSGPKVEAASVIWPSAHLYAVSVGDVPGQDLQNRVGPRLSIYEMYLSDFLSSCECNSFDLVTLFSVNSDELDRALTYLQLKRVVRQNGYLFYYEGGARAIKPFGRSTLEKNFTKVSVPHEMMLIGDFELWTPNK